MSESGAEPPDCWMMEVPQHDSPTPGSRTAKVLAAQPSMDPSRTPDAWRVLKLEPQLLLRYSADSAPRCGYVAFGEDGEWYSVDKGPSVDWEWAPDTASHVIEDLLLCNSISTTHVVIDEAQHVNFLPAGPGSEA